MGPKSHSASHWCRGAAASAGLIEAFPARFPPLCLYIRRKPRRLVNVAVLAPKNGEQLLGRHRFLNELHESLVFERFCEKGESSRIERVLAH
jgi:hypothetical protein